KALETPPFSSKGGGPVSERTHNEPVNSVQTKDLMNTTDERPAFDFNDETIARPFEMPKMDEDLSDDEDVVIVDDIAEVVEGDEEEEEESKTRQSPTPPPLPRN